MKHLNESELASAVPVQKPSMTRAEKLRHWARLVRSYGSYLALFHLLEHQDDRWMQAVRPSDTGYNAFSLAASDPTFAAQGLKPDATLYDIRNFMELSQDELHEFSCDCGGSIANKEMARRIEKLAGPTSVLVVDSSSWTGRAMHRLLGH